MNFLKRPNFTNFQLIKCSLITLLLFPSLLGSQEKPFLLVLGLDGISYQLAEELRKDGQLSSFESSTPMIATFPSISDPNWTKLVQAPLEKSYTKAHFSRGLNEDGTTGKEVGTIINHLTTPPQFEKSFDFKPMGVLQHMLSLTWAQASALYWMESLTKLLLEPEAHDKDIFKAFIINTDMVSHMRGKKEVSQYIQKVHKHLEELRTSFKTKYKRTLEVVIVSDHGNYYVKKSVSPKVIDFEKTLAKKGWNKKPTLSNNQDYAFVAPEIISFGAFYTLPKQENKLAQLFTNIEGVHVALTSGDNNQVHVFSKNSEAEIRIDHHNHKVSYKIIRGTDPFNHIQYFKNKKALTFVEYFRKTRNDQYPNALVRAWEGLTNNTEEGASVLVSPKLGYVFTNLTLEILTSLSGVKSSHGSFDKEESLGVVLSTFKIKNEAIAPHQFIDYIKRLGYSFHSNESVALNTIE